MAAACFDYFKWKFMDFLSHCRSSNELHSDVGRHSGSPAIPHCRQSPRSYEFYVQWTDGWYIPHSTYICLLSAVVHIATGQFSDRRRAAIWYACRYALEMCWCLYFVLLPAIGHQVLVLQSTASPLRINFESATPHSRFAMAHGEQLICSLRQQRRCRLL